jgi:hypothetical protein
MSLLGGLFWCIEELSDMTYIPWWTRVGSATVIVAARDLMVRDDGGRVGGFAKAEHFL